MRYYLGLDAGGTKTFCLAGDASGRVLGFGRAATGNYECFGVPAAKVEIEKAVQGALSSAGLTLDQISGIGMGIAGADIPDDYEMLDKEIFGPVFGSVRRCFRNDSMAGLRGGLREPYGIVIACGTGCVCAGVNRAGVEARVGGLNEDFGDTVSGSTIGMEGIRAVWRARDRVLPPTLLTAKFVQRAGCSDVEDMFYKMYTGKIPFAALEPAAPLVFDAAREGDAAAADILEASGKYLAQMVLACASKLDMCRDHFNVVMAGSVFKGSSPVLVDAMTTGIHRIAPDARMVMPLFEPVVGALLLGIELDVEVTETIYGTLSSELEAAESRFGVRFKSE